MILELLNESCLVMLSVVALTIVKGKKGDRMKNAKMLAGASFLAFTAMGAAKLAS